MINLSIKFPEELAQRLVVVFERALTIIEFHFATPSTDMAWQEITKGAEVAGGIKEATISDYDPNYEAKLDIAIERYVTRTGANFDEFTLEDLESDMADIEQDWKDAEDSF